MSTTPISIPMLDFPDYTVSVTLDGQEWKLRFYWNTRGLFWSMDIKTANNVLTLAGVRLIVSYPMTEQHTALDIPKGTFLIVDQNELTKYQDPGRNDFVSGRNLKLVYIGVE